MQYLHSSLEKQSSIAPLPKSHDLINLSAVSSSIDNIAPAKIPKKITTNYKGFSLVELMVTIAIAGIALAIALPSLNSFTVQMRVDNEVAEIQRLLMTTRNAAINSGLNATLCPLNENDTCQNTLVWTGRIGVISVDGLIKEKAAIKAGDKLDFAFSTVTYNASGQLDTNNIDVFSYCPKGLNDFSRGVDVSLSGRTYLSSDSDGDGIDEDRSKNKIVCN